LVGGGGAGRALIVFNGYKRLSALQWLHSKDLKE
jgi:hypothetical protein